jgi:hypothetical protein
MLLVCVLVTALAREGCATASPAAAVASTAGWTVRHEIDPGHPRADTLLRQLADRPPNSHVRETVFTDPTGSWERVLQRQGWTLAARTPVAATGREPSVAVVDANGVERWRGGYPSEAGAGFAPDLLVATVASGHVLPPVVPVFCTVPSPSS